MIIHKKVCDECKKEFDLTQEYFGRYPIWQEIKIRDEHEQIITIDVCSNKCAIAILQRIK